MRVNGIKAKCLDKEFANGQTELAMMECGKNALKKDLVYFITLMELNIKGTSEMICQVAMGRRLLVMDPYF